MTIMNTDEDHERWAELAAGHVLSSLDDADQALYVEHAALCSSCQELERELSATLADLAQVPAQVTPPSSLKASIMRAVIEDDGKHTAPVVSIGGRSPVIDITDVRPGSRKAINKHAWLTAVAAAGVVIAATVVGVNLTGHQQASVATRCAKEHCPTVALRADGHQVATVMVLGKIAYVQADGLPETPRGDSYVLWRISDGQPPVGIAAVRTRPTSGPVKVGSVPVLVSAVTTFALSEENGDSVPAAPTDVIAQGNAA